MLKPNFRPRYEQTTKIFHSLAIYEHGYLHPLNTSVCTHDTSHVLPKCNPKLILITEKPINIIVYDLTDSKTTRRNKVTRIDSWS
jgi:hypothetical protein